MNTRGRTIARSGVSSLPSSSLLLVLISRVHCKGQIIRVPPPLRGPSIPAPAPVRPFRPTSLAPSLSNGVRMVIVAPGRQRSLLFSHRASRKAINCGWNGGWRYFYGAMKFHVKVFNGRVSPHQTLAMKISPHRHIQQHPTPST